MSPSYTTLELLERYETDLEKRQWWEDNMPPSSKYKPTYKYRRTVVKVDDIERIIAIPNNTKECKVRFYAGYSLVVLADYEDLCIKFNDLCNGTVEYGLDEN